MEAIPANKRKNKENEVDSLVKKLCNNSLHEDVKQPDENISYTKHQEELETLREQHRVAIRKYQRGIELMKVLLRKQLTLLNEIQPEDSYYS